LHLHAPHALPAPVPEPGHAAMHQRVIQNGGMVTQPPSPVVHQAAVLKAPALSTSDSVSWFQLWNPPRSRTTGHACPKVIFLQPCVGIGRYPANQKKLRGRESNLYFRPSTSVETSRRDIRPTKPRAFSYHSQTAHFISMTFNPTRHGFPQGLCSPVESECDCVNQRRGLPFSLFGKFT
jgi:hypothetical protein